MKKPSLKDLGSNKSLWLILIIIILIVASIPAYYYYDQYKKTQALLQNPSAPVNTQVKDLIDKVGKLIELPQGETPTVATVSDITKLAGQSFFAQAVNGDKVLIYTQAKEAILFRESINKIIQVAPINIGQIASGSASNITTPTTAPVSIAIYNGTTTAGLAAKAESKITEAISNVSVLTKADAKGNYSKTQIIDVSQKQNAIATQIANLLGGSVSSTIPSGETKSAADIVVILGTDFAK